MVPIRWVCSTSGPHLGSCRAIAGALSCGPVTVSPTVPLALLRPLSSLIPCSGSMGPWWPGAENLLLPFAPFVASVNLRAAGSKPRGDLWGRALRTALSVCVCVCARAMCFGVWFLSQSVCLYSSDAQTAHPSCTPPLPVVPCGSGVYVCAVWCAHTCGEVKEDHEAGIRESLHCAG